MQVSDAIRLVQGITYKPGWSVRAHASKRYEGTIDLAISYTVRNSNKEYAPTYTEPIYAVMDLFVRVDDCDGEIDLFGKILECLLQIERHECREFLTVHGEEYDKPFHPHTVEGMTNWANRRTVIEAEDMTLGVMTYA